MKVKKILKYEHFVSLSMKLLCWHSEAENAIRARWIIILEVILQVKASFSLEILFFAVRIFKILLRN